MSPRKHVDKTYYAQVEGLVRKAYIKLFQDGLDIGDDTLTLPAELKILRSGETSEIELTIHEGRFHQVKRMLEAVGCKVTYLKRLSMGSLTLGELLPGQVRTLTEEEIKKLKDRT